MFNLKQKYEIIPDRGFTLLEMLVVVSIIFILSAIGLHYFRSNKYELNSFVETLVGNMNRARLRAVTSNKTVYIDFGNGNGRYVIWIDNNGDGVYNASKDKIITDVQNKRILFVTLPTAGRFYFNSLGQGKAGNILIKIQNCVYCKTYKVIVNNMGRVRVEQQ